MLIDGLALAGYRSFGEDIQRIGPFEKMNLFAGPNNAGKSNILRFLTLHYATLVAVRAGQPVPSGAFSDTDRHIGKGSGTFAFGIGRRMDDERYNSLRQTLQEGERHLFESMLGSQIISQGTNCVWIERVAATLGGPMNRREEIVQRLLDESGLSSRDWRALCVRLCPNGQAGRVPSWISGIVELIDPFVQAVPAIELIPAVRAVGGKGSTTEGFGGQGIIDRLARLQNPEREGQNKKDRFDQINRFLRRVVGNDSATLEIPYDRDCILVHMDGKTLPLESLGTGIHEVVILAAAATCLVDQVICIEEPELHMHPLLQRRLTNYLLEKTTNQYFITTHSSHLLDERNVAVFHVRLVDGQSVVTPALTSIEKYDVCVDLGCRASDLMQSNCIVWVEGPSDRIYLNHWIAARDSELIEGMHYSIMFYGGRLLNHLSADDPEVNDFISLRRLNRNLAILMDSDRGSSGKRLNETKLRVRKEFDDGRGFAWVTKGREIENYVTRDILKQAVEQVHPGRGGSVKNGQYDIVIPYVNPKARKPRRVDKIKVAREVAEHPADLDVLDLESQIRRLIEFIRDVN